MSRTPRMPKRTPEELKERQKQYIRTWDNQHMKTVSCRLRTEDYDLFKTALELDGSNPARFLRKAIFQYVIENESRILEEYKKAGKDPYVLPENKRKLVED